MAKAKLPYEDAKKQFKRFPIINPKRTVQQNWSESVPLERKERRALGLDGLNRTADRMLTFDRPVNGNASGSIKSWRHKQKKPARSVSVYLARFTSKITDEPAFLKIGITNDLGERFGFDAYRFTREYVKTVDGLTRKEALQIESRLHSMFCSKSYSPKLRLLSNGNTECFLDEEEIVSTTTRLFALVEAELRTLA